MPNAPSPTTTVAEALQRISGMYGAAYDSTGKLLSEVVHVTGTADVADIPVPLVGKTQMGHKPGRVTRAGTLRYQKVDSFWEMRVWEFMSQSLAQRRANRDRGITGLPQFTLLLEYDDPDALGIEKWQLDGCQLYRLNLGFDIGTDLTELEIPLTWEEETPIYAFQRVLGSNGAYAPQWSWTWPGGVEVASYGPPPAE